MSDILLTTEQAADLLRVKPATLKMWRINGAGPAFVKVGRLVRYRRATIENWLSALPEHKMTA
ncbi:MAG: DNA-binding protein [Methylocystaceae bacterium]|nr:DNA-binding protein [Methylocystaceae bacterium]